MNVPFTLIEMAKMFELTKMRQRPNGLSVLLTDQCIELVSVIVGY